MGCTLSELSERLSWREFHQWIAWRRVHGPICNQLRSDYHAAAIAQAMCGGTLDDNLIKFRTEFPLDDDDQEDRQRKFTQILDKLGVNERNFKTFQVHRPPKEKRKGKT